MDQFKAKLKTKFAEQGQELEVWAKSFGPIWEQSCSVQFVSFK